LTKIAAARLQSGDCHIHQKKNDDPNLLLGPSAVASLESCSDPKQNLILNQLPKKFRTPRKPEAVSRNSAGKDQNSKLSTGKKPLENQFLETPNNHFLETAETPPDGQFLETPDEAKASNSLGFSNCLKSLAAPCFEENHYPKDNDFDEETFIDPIDLSSDSLDSKIRRAGERADARSRRRAKNSAVGRKSKLDSLKAKAKNLAKTTQETGEAQDRPNPVTVVLADEADSGKAYEMAAEYEAALKIYRKKPFLKVFKTRVLSEQAHKVLLRAANFAEELDVDYETYMKAQFWAMHEWFKRPPKLHQIASFKTKVPAKERVKLYLKATRQGQFNSKREIRSLSRPAPKVSLSVRFQNSERQLRRLMKNYGESEEKILCRFASKRTSYTYFDREWLRENPTYQRLLQEGRI
jgi:hypothetical protein